MAGREHQQRSRSEDAEPPVPEPVAPSAAGAQARTQEIDDLLGEIDAVLETNAEAFVRGFVQKGGQ